MGNPNIELHYETTGHGPPLLLIHGLGSSGLDWEYQIPEFSKDFCVIVPDLRGHGRSPKPAGPYSMAMLAADIAELLRAEASGPAHVVGLSLGGGVAFQLALDYPELVKTVVIVNSGPHAVMETFKQKFAIWMRFVIIRLFGLPKLGQVVSKKLFPNDERLRQTFVERYSHNDPTAYKAALRALAGWSVQQRLGEIRCPLLALTADQDYTPVAFKQSYVDQIKGAQLVVVPDTHHALPMENPPAFNRALREFISAHP